MTYRPGNHVAVGEMSVERLDRIGFAHRGVGLVATIAGSAAGVAAVGVGLWQVGLAIGDRRRQRRKHGGPLDASAAPPAASRTFEQGGQRVGGAQMNVIGHVGQLVGEVKLTCERARPFTVDDDELAEGKARLAAMPPDTLPPTRNRSRPARACRCRQTRSSSAAPTNSSASPRR